MVGGPLSKRAIDAVDAHRWCYSEHRGYSCVGGNATIAPEHSSTHRHPYLLWIGIICFPLQQVGASFWGIEDAPASFPTIFGRQNQIVSLNASWYHSTGLAHIDIQKLIVLAFTRCPY